MSPGLWGVAMVALMLGAEPAPAPAPAPDDVTRKKVQAYLVLATDLFKSGDYEGALTELKRIDGMQEIAAVRFNIARCLEELKRDAEALAAYQRFLATPDSSASAEKLRARAKDAVARLQATAAGTLQVSCPVDGTAVEVVGVTPAKPCPFTQEAVPVGTHVLRASKAGFSPYETKVEIAAGKIARHTVQLEPDAATLAAMRASIGTLVVTCSVESTLLEIVGVTSAPVTCPHTQTPLPPGAYTVRAVREGYIPYSMTVAVEGGKTATVVVELLPESKPATTVAVAPPPPPVGTTGTEPVAPPPPPAVEPAPAEKPVEPPAEKPAEKPVAEVKPAPAEPPTQAKFGEIVLRGSPEGTEGKLLGDNVSFVVKLPWTGKDLRPGRYHLELSPKGYRSLSGQVEVVAGRRSEVTATLVKAPEEDDLRDDGPRADLGKLEIVMVPLAGQPGVEDPKPAAASVAAKRPVEVRAGASKPGSGVRAGGVALTVIGVLGAGAGVGLYFAGASSEESINKGGFPNAAAIQSAADEASTFYTGSVAALVAGGVLAVTGIVMIAAGSGSSSAPAPASVSVAPVLLPGGGGVAFSGTLP